MKKISKYSIILMALFFIVMINPIVHIDKTIGVEVDYSEILADPIYGDDFEYVVEEPDIGSSCAVLCYGAGYGCEDWTGGGVGYEYGGKCSDLMSL